jgi:hypothetical protein
MSSKWRALLFILALVNSAVVGASENSLDLKHIRLSESFKAALEATSGNTKSLKSTQTVDPRLALIPFLFDAEVAQQNSQSQAKNFAKNTPTDGQESLLYGQIRDWLDNRYQGIGQAESERVALFNNQFNLGVQNFSGFSWQKPFGGFGIYTDRQLSPDLFDANRWIVMDTFTVVIEATSFLGKMNEAGAVDMTTSEIAAFAGINFKRVYTTFHFANSFMEGLVADYRYLFLPFLAHTPNGALELNNGRVLRREDTWSAALGGLIESPPWYGFSFSAGAMAEITNQSTLTLQSVTPQEANRPGEFLRVSHKSGITKSAGVTAALQLDFFKLIKFTLLSYDLEFSSEKSNEFQLSFREEHKNKLTDDSETAQEFAQVIRKNSPNIRYLEPFVTRLDQSHTTSTNSRTMLLLWGSLKKSSMEQVKVIKDQAVKIFFKNYNESIRLVQNFWSRLFSSFIFRIFQFNTIIKNDAAFTRKLNLEYEATLPQSPDPNKMLIESQEQFSMMVSMSYQAARTDRWVDRSYKGDVVEFMERFTTLSVELRNSVNKEDLKGPIMVSTNIRVMGDGLHFFNQLTEQQVINEFNLLCAKKSSCVKALRDPYLAYKKVYHDTGKLELALLKKMLTTFLKEIDDLASFQVLFGENAFVTGSLHATSRQGLPFSTAFSVGQFRGLGVIDTFKRLNGTRQPASIWSE